MSMVANVVVRTADMMRDPGHATRPSLTMMNIVHHADPGIASDYMLHIAKTVPYDDRGPVLADWTVENRRLFERDRAAAYSKAETAASDVHAEVALAGINHFINLAKHDFWPNFLRVADFFNKYSEDISPEFGSDRQDPVALKNMRSTLDRAAEIQLANGDRDEKVDALEKAHILLGNKQLGEVAANFLLRNVAYVHALQPEKTEPVLRDIALTLFGKEGGRRAAMFWEMEIDALKTERDPGIVEEHAAYVAAVAPKGSPLALLAQSKANGREYPRTDIKPEIRDAEWNNKFANHPEISRFPRPVTERHSGPNNE